jgi:hypothetical protein
VVVAEEQDDRAFMGATVEVGSSAAQLDDGPGRGFCNGITFST